MHLCMIIRAGYCKSNRTKKWKQCEGREELQSWQLIVLFFILASAGFASKDNCSSLIDTCNCKWLMQTLCYQAPRVL
ncbi:hypothetical protein EUGRSUZ_F03032 [Eucalyptus grandis]|uniref:Uncharacterized protein n=2 Tax=Eucalyptus grandis TaxID=71139 RepID=A0ACC3KJV0_EUCGR|nr:hypothetical protein EUGRSUZ_F03032 [Eucalyptus grandis]